MSYLDSCAIPVVYCGNKTSLPSRVPNQEYYYSVHGTPFECMKKGVGIGMATVKNKDLKINSLRKIKYVGEVYEENFKKTGINTITDLMDYDDDATKLDTLLNQVFTKKNGQVDLKAYNSTLMFLYKANVQNLPECAKFTPISK